MEKKYAGLLEKKWTSVIRLQKKVKEKIAISDLLFEKGAYFHAMQNSIIARMQFFVFKSYRRLDVWAVIQLMWAPGLPLLSSELSLIASQSFGLSLHCKR